MELKDVLSGNKEINLFEIEIPAGKTGIYLLQCKAVPEIGFMLWGDTNVPLSNKISFHVVSAPYYAFLCMCCWPTYSKSKPKESENSDQQLSKIIIKKCRELGIKTIVLKHVARIGNLNVLDSYNFIDEIEKLYGLEASESLQEIIDLY